MSDKKIYIEDIKKFIYAVFEKNQIKLHLLKLDAKEYSKDQYQFFLFSLNGSCVKDYFKLLFGIAFDKQTIYPAQIHYEMQIYPDIDVKDRAKYFYTPAENFIIQNNIISNILIINMSDIKKFVEQAECSLEAELAYKNTLETKLLACMSLLKNKKKERKI